VLSAWRWTAARSIGTSHTKSGLPCQDFALGLEIESAGGSVFAAVVSDGAGTARHAQAGAKMVCATFLRAALAHFKSGRVVEDIVDDDILGWLDGLRDRINAFAARREARPRDCAATLVGLLAGPTLRTRGPRRGRRRGRPGRRNIRLDRSLLALPGRVRFDDRVRDR
jgi:hypothetical protein